MSNNNFTTSIHTVLKNLIEEKSNRDAVKFTSSQLANALCMPRSMITKLTHPIHSKRVVNPRIDTLLKIVDFFRQDGFDITIDHLLGATAKAINVQDQKITSNTTVKTIPLYTFDNSLKVKLELIEIKFQGDTSNIIALLSDSDVSSIFKKGSIFIIDQKLSPENDMLIAAKIAGFDKIQIRKYICKKKVRELHPIALDNSSPKQSPIKLNEIEHSIIGVVVQVNAKT